MKKLLIFIIKLYQKTPLSSHSYCKFIPTCSNYGIDEGLIMEFGRPGKRSGGVDKKGRRIGQVSPTPHVYRAVDNKGDAATSHVVDSVSEVIKW